MATQPMMQPMADPAADQGQGADTDEAGSVELCIEVAVDGSLSVYKEMGDNENGEAAEMKQPAADIGAALKMVLDLYKSLGQKDANAEFDEGFGQPPSSARVQRGFK